MEYFRPQQRIVVEAAPRILAQKMRIGHYGGVHHNSPKRGSARALPIVAKGGGNTSFANLHKKWNKEQEEAEKEKSVRKSAAEKDKRGFDIEHVENETRRKRALEGEKIEAEYNRILKESNYLEGGQ